MTTLTQPLAHTDLYPLLVSELPVSPVRGPSSRTQRKAVRRFERALQASTGQETTDLIAQLRAQRTVTRTFT